MNLFYHEVAYKEALKNFVIPNLVSTEQAMEWGWHLNTKQYATLVKIQRVLSNAARAECNLQRKINLATQSQLMREAAEAFACKHGLISPRF